MTFDQLMQARDWQPIRNCPGRYVLHGERTALLRPQDILEDEIEVNEFKVAAAKDTVLVVKLEGGGLITYRRDDGSFLHTLNTMPGFQRKLAQLGIESGGVSE